ncbi:hypothetical protein HK101_002402, partial [Irineochytrium annulatum]
MANFSEVRAAIESEDDAKILKAADAALASSDDADLTHVKVAALIKLDRFSEALALLESSPNSQEEELLFEKAYCLYKTFRNAESLECLDRLRKKFGSQSAGVDHLELQVDDPLKTEIVSNVYAAYSGAELALGPAAVQDIQVADKRVDEETYEIIYNRACIQIGKGNIEDAEGLLRDAFRVGRQVMVGEGCSEEEIRKELLIVELQLAYVLQRRRKFAEALKANTAAALLTYRSSGCDLGLHAVACNNIVALRGANDLFDSIKRHRSCFAHGVDQKLTSAQRRTMTANASILSALTKKYSKSKDLAKKLVTDFTDDGTGGLLLAGIMAMEKKGMPKAFEELKSQAASHSDSFVLALALAQQYITNGMLKEAMNALDDFSKSAPKAILYSPGFLSLITWLKAECGKVEAANELIEKASTYLLSLEKPGDNTMRKSIATFKLNAGVADPARDYEGIVKKHSGDMEAIAGLVLAYADRDLAAADQYRSHLPDLDQLIGRSGGVDVDALEAMTMPAQNAAKKREAPEESVTAKKTSSKRKRKPLKNFDPAVQPDPERWLPKYERSSYKKKQKKGEVSRGPQGAS